MHHGVVGLGHWAQCVAWMVNLASAWPLARHTQGFGCGLAQSIAGGRFAGVAAVLVEPGLQLRHLPLQGSELFGLPLHH